MSLLGVLGILAAAAFWWLTREGDAAEPEDAKRSGVESAKGSGRGFGALLATGILDSAGRMGFLTFLPFLLNSKGAGTAGVGLALTLLFVGGAFGKLACGYLGARIGMMRTVWATESATALFIVIAVVSPLVATMAMMPLLGVALNGTSSVLYGTVPELAAPGRREHAFALFYTGVIGAGALAPVLFGRLGDAAGITTALMVLAGSLLLTLPLSWCAQRHVGR
jgi:predicted MFS family arabinose efflux permease